MRLFDESQGVRSRYSPMAELSGLKSLRTLNDSSEKRSFSLTDAFRSVCVSRRTGTSTSNLFD